MDSLEKYLSLPQTNNDFSLIFLSLIFCALGGYLLKFFYDKYSNYDLSNKKISSILPISGLMSGRWQCESTSRILFYDHKRDENLVNYILSTHSLRPKQQFTRRLYQIAKFK